MTVKVWIVLGRPYGGECHELRGIFTVEEAAHRAAAVLNRKDDEAAIARARAFNWTFEIRPGVGLYERSCFLVCRGEGPSSSEQELGVIWDVEEWATNMVDGAQPPPEKRALAPSND